MQSDGVLPVRAHVAQHRVKCVRPLNPAAPPHHQRVAGRKIQHAAGDPPRRRQFQHFKRPCRQPRQVVPVRVPVRFVAHVQQQAIPPQIAPCVQKVLRAAHIIACIQRFRVPLAIAWFPAVRVHVHHPPHKLHLRELQRELFHEGDMLILIHTQHAPRRFQRRQPPPQRPDVLHIPQSDIQADLCSRHPLTSNRLRFSTTRAPCASP